MQPIIRGAIIAFLIVSLMMLSFNVIIVPDGFSGTSNTIGRLLGMYVPLLVWLAVVSALVALRWSFTYARNLLLAAFMLQIMLLILMSGFVWYGMPFPLPDLFIGMGFCFGLPLVTIAATILFSYLLEKSVLEAKNW